MKSEKRKKVLIYVGLTFLAVLMAVPFYWMLISSVKLNKDVFSIPMEWIPRSFHFENYQEIWEKIPPVSYTHLDVYKRQRHSLRGSVD